MTSEELLRSIGIDPADSVEVRIGKQIIETVKDAYANGAAEERAAIVKWLRDLLSNGLPLTGDQRAILEVARETFDAGEHRK